MPFMRTKLRSYSHKVRHRERDRQPLGLGGLTRTVFSTGKTQDRSESANLSDLAASLGPTCFMWRTCWSRMLFHYLPTSSRTRPTAEWTRCGDTKGHSPLTGVRDEKRVSIYCRDSSCVKNLARHLGKNWRARGFIVACETACVASERDSPSTRCPDSSNSHELGYP